jgi:citrate lyase beta subunit
MIEVEMVKEVLPSSFVDALARELEVEAPAVSGRVRPVHVLYGGAHLFRAGVVDKLGDRARAALAEWGDDAEAFARTVGVTEPELASEVWQRVRTKLERRPIESMCIDFEDGYGPRGDDDEDGDATRTAEALAATPETGTSIGIRIKALGGPTARRGIRTLERFVTTLATATGGRLRPGFSVTLPKITSARHVGALVELLERLEASLGISVPIDVELMIESPSALFDPRGFALASLLDAARGRAIAVHLGAYDFTAELGVTAADQRLDHPYCDLARMLLKIGTTGRDIGVADGATTLLPIAAKDAPRERNRGAIHQAWSAHAANVRRAISFGIWQGWDLHPAQLPARYGALSGFFLAARPEMTKRLRTFVEGATRASRVDRIFDDAATAEGLVTFFARGLACGALDEDDLRATSLEPSDLSLSFAEIVRRRREVP